MTRFRTLMLAAALQFLAVPFLALSFLSAPGCVFAQDARDYLLGPEDVVQIQAWQRPDLSGSYTVDSRGNIRLPLLGEITVKGRTTGDISSELQRRYSIVDPSITEVLLTVTGFNSLRVNVLGEVRNPARYGFQKMPTVWDAVLAAGGPTPQADMGRVQIVHRDETSGQSRTSTVDLSRGLEATDIKSLPALKPGDSIVIPSAATNAVIGDQVEVLGAVKTPGLYSARTANSVLTALAVAGGAAPGASLNKVRLARRNSGAVAVYELDVRRYLSEGTPDADLALLPGDVLSVPGGDGPGKGTNLIFQGLALLTTVTTFFLAINNSNN